MISQYCICVCAVCIYIMNCASKPTTVLGGGVVSCSQPHPSPMFCPTTPEYFNLCSVHQISHVVLYRGYMYMLYLSLSLSLCIVVMSYTSIGTSLAGTPYLSFPQTRVTLGHYNNFITTNLYFYICMPRVIFLYSCPF